MEEVTKNTTEEEYQQIKEEDLELVWKELNDEQKDKAWLYQKFPIEFLKKHQKEIDWPKLSLNMKSLTFEVLDTFPSKISWTTICFCPRVLSESLLYNYRNKIIWTAVLSHQRLDLKFLIIMSEIYRKSRSKNQRDFWDAVSRFEVIDDEYVDAYKRFINFRLLSHNTNITPETIDKYITKLDVEALIKTVKIPKEIIMKHKEIFLKK